MNGIVKVDDGRSGISQLCGAPAAIANEERTVWSCDYYDYRTINVRVTGSVYIPYVHMYWHRLFFCLSITYIHVYRVSFFAVVVWLLSLVIISIPPISGGS
jgi:hypothetical protein